MKVDNLPTEDEALDFAPSAPVKPVEQTPKPEAPASGVSEAKVDDATLKRLEAMERRYGQLENQLRGVQSSKDKEIAETRKQMKERLKQERAAMSDLLARSGVDESQVRAFRETRDREDEVEALREEAAQGRAYQAMTQAEQARESVITNRLKEIASDYGVTITRDDQRLDDSDPTKFEASLSKAIAQELKRQSQAKTTPTKENAEDSVALARAAEKERQSKIRSQVDPLGGGSAGGSSSDDELPDDNDALWKMAMGKNPSLKRGR